MESFAGKFAAVTGGGSGMGRELVRQLASEGCSVAACDVHADTVAETVTLALAGAPDGTTVTGHVCDVADEGQVLRFRDEALAAHGAGHVDLVFSNAGIGGGGSFLNDPREQWERVFAVDFWGTYYCARAFLPLLVKSPEGVLVNTSSVNGFWASLGPGIPHTAYSTAKFAVKGLSEALIEDLRLNAPHVRVAVVMPGHVGTNIVANSMLAFGVPGADALAASKGFRDTAPLSAAGAATVILDGVRSGAWRILVGQDAQFLDSYIRANPEDAYDHAKLAAARERLGTEAHDAVIAAQDLAKDRPASQRELPAAAAVLLLPQPLGLLAGHAPGLVAAQVMVAAGVEVPVDLGGHEGGEELLRDPVMDRDALAFPVVFVHPHGLEPDGGREELVGDLVVREPAAVDGVVGVPVAGVVPLREKSHVPELPPFGSALTGRPRTAAG